MITATKHNESLLLQQMMNDHLWLERNQPVWRIAHHRELGAVGVSVPNEHHDLFEKIIKAIGLEWSSDQHQVESRVRLLFCDQGPYGCWNIDDVLWVRCYALNIVSVNQKSKKQLWEFLKTVFLGGI